MATASMTSEGGGVAVAVTGASGARYALRLLEVLAQSGETVHWVVSDAGRQVLALETGVDLLRDPGAGDDLPFAGREHLRRWRLDDWTSPLASGSGFRGALVICPCSMGTLAAVATGLADTLIERAADVALKEGRPLVLVPRETPLSVIHLENMLKLARMGAIILPAMPGFYRQPQEIQELVDFVVGRILTRLGLPGLPQSRWGMQPG
ncbi:MAG: UbiX family flavin prenyltransferase [Magnetococcus sp. WYHC-3]